MSTKVTYIGVVLLLIIACLVGFVLYRTLARDSLLIPPYAVLPASSTVSVLGSKSTLILDRLFSTSSEAGTFAKTVQVGSVGVSAAFIDLRVIGEPVKVSEITFTMRPVMGRELHSESIRRIVVKREGLESEHAEGVLRECSSSECRFAVNVSNLFRDVPAAYSVPVRLKLEADLEAPGTVNLGDAFQFVVARAEDVKAQGLNGEGVSVMNLGSTVAAIHVVPVTTRVSASWPVDVTIIPVSERAQIGTFEVVNESEMPIYIDSVMFEIDKEIKGKVYYSLRASLDGSNPNDVAIVYAEGRRNGYFGDISTVSLEKRWIKPKSWRYLTVFAEGNLRLGDAFEVKVRDIGNIRFGVSEKDLGYSGNPDDDTDTGDLLGGLLSGGVPKLGRITIR